MLYFGSLARMLKKYCHISNKRPPNCVIRKFRAKLRILKFGTKNCLMLLFWAAILKNHCHISNQHPWIYCHIWNQHPRICLSLKFCEETEMPKFGTKNALFGYFWAKYFKNDCHIWNEHLFWIVKFCEETKEPKFGTKNALFRLELKTTTKYCHIWKQHHWICLIAKYHEIMKMLKFGIKSALLEYFWARILKSYSHIWNEITSELEWLQNFVKKRKFLDLGPKMSYFAVFGL